MRKIKRLGGFIFVSVIFLIYLFQGNRKINSDAVKNYDLDNNKLPRKRQLLMPVKIPNVFDRFETDIHNFASEVALKSGNNSSKISDIKNTHKNDRTPPPLNEITLEEIVLQKPVEKVKDTQYPMSITRKVKIPPSFGTRGNSRRFDNVIKALNSVHKSANSPQPTKVPQFPNIFGASIFNVSQASNLNQFQNLTPSIPHIIHQIWDSYEIPGLFKPWIKSIVERHPGWEYWLWTLDDAECLLRTRYSQDILQLYRSYTHIIYKSDFIRYFILYEFGGFYLDLDVEALKPMDFWTYKHQCVMSHENYEHSFILHKREQTNLVNGIMGSRSKHPYFKILQENLGLYHRKYPNSPVDATGPIYITKMYDKFKLKNISKLRENAITVIHPKYWLPLSDKGQTNNIRTDCRQRLAEYPAPAAKKMCAILERQFYKHTIPNDAFLDHKWEHINLWRGNKKQQDLFNIFDVVPSAKKVSSILRCP